MSQESVIEHPTATALERRATELVGWQDFAITDAGSLAVAVDVRRQAKEFLLEWAGFFDPIQQSQRETARITKQQRDRLEAPIKALWDILGQRAAAYEMEQRRLAAEAAAAAERERQRLEAEAKAQAKAEQARLQKEAEDALILSATKAEQAGDTITAERLLTQPVHIPPVPVAPVFMPPVVMPTPTKLDNGGYWKDDCEVECLSLMDLCQAIAAGRFPVGMVTFHDAAAKRWAKDNAVFGTRDTEVVRDGVRFKQTLTTVQRVKKR